MTIFAGPCLAKKKEAKEPDIADAVDYVLTFQEMQDIFDAAEISLEELPEEEKEHASKAGRLYARTGGVSQGSGGDGAAAFAGWKDRCSL